MQEKIEKTAPFLVGVLLGQTVVSEHILKGEGGELEILKDKEMKKNVSRSYREYLYDSVLSTT